MQRKEDPLIFIVFALTIIGLTSFASGQNRLPGFGAIKARSPILGFGRDAELWQRLSADDLRRAKDYMTRYDSNRNGTLESNETINWSPATLRRYDLNGDGKILFRELALGFKALRGKRAKKPAKKAAQQTLPPVNRPLDPAVFARRNMCNGLAAELIARHDRNRNKQLELSEWQSSKSRFAKFSGGADSNGDNKITSSELSAWLVRRLPPLATARLARPLRLIDVNGDGQISMSEYSLKYGKNSFAQFAALDRNNDGLITPQESYAAPVPRGTIGFSSNDAKLITSRGRVTSVIWINKDLRIADLDVRVAITKQNDNLMQLYLIGPDGQQVTLYAGGWQPWSDTYTFESTLIDDEAPLIKKTLPRAPFPRKLRTDALKKGGPSLKHFYGKSARGSWRLIAVNSNNQVGVLHHWSLWVKPKKD